ncbi:hypothetical protein [Streptomyces sp. NPDC058045]|uniref:hypothetical protein n=1 Tax=Streptomyces sp. NPDC058045 TaxID=3346311 RepID=UPI0036ECC439
MPKTSTPAPTVPDTAWLGRGRHLGPEPEQDVRRNLIALKAAGVIDDFLDLAPPHAESTEVGPLPDPFGAESGPPLPETTRRRFEARWRVDETVTVRAQLTTYEVAGRRRTGEAVSWVLAAEAERPWELRWPSPATMFWPDSDRVLWDYDVVPGPRVRAVSPLPADDKEMRRLLKDCVRQSWNIHVVVHEAMTPDERGRRPFALYLPPSLRHRVVEHRAAPEQSQIADWAVRDLGVRLPRGGAVVLPTATGGPGPDPERFAVRNVFLDGSEPTELVQKVIAVALRPRPATADTEHALTELRGRWHLLTMEEELAHTRELVTKYADALEAMTKSRDLYREAAERAQAALAAAPRPPVPAPATPADPAATRQDGSPLSALTKAFGRFRDGGKPPS